jgi:hypothetical protein
MNEVCLSAKGLKNIMYPNDFTFVVGSATYPCCSFVASFLSPKIAALCRCDPTITSYSIKTKEKSNEFLSVLALGEGFPVALTQSDRMFLLDVSLELENTELYDLILTSFDGKFEGEDAEDVLAGKLRRGMNCEKDVAALASHFSERGERILKMFEYDALCTILGSGSLVVESEDWLFTRLLSVIEQDANKFGLLEFVYFELVSCEHMKQFASVSSKLLHLVNSVV